MSDRQVPIERDRVDAEDRVPPEVAAIVLRASELGFSATRVAVALGVSARALASIQNDARRESTPTDADNIASDRRSDP